MHPTRYRPPKASPSTCIALLVDSRPARICILARFRRRVAVGFQSGPALVNHARAGRSGRFGRVRGTGARSSPAGTRSAPVVAYQRPICAAADVAARARESGGATCPARRVALQSAVTSRLPRPAACRSGRRIGAGRARDADGPAREAPDLESSSVTEARRRPGRHRAPDTVTGTSRPTGHRWSRPAEAVPLYRCCATSRRYPVSQHMYLGGGHYTASGPVRNPLNYKQRRGNVSRRRMSSWDSHGGCYSTSGFVTRFSVSRP